MRVIIICFLCTIICSTLEVNGQSSVNKIVKQLKKTEHYEGISVPGWLIRLGLKLATNDDNQATLSGLARISKKIKRIRVATTTLDIKKYNTKAIVNNFVKSVQEKDRFEEYISVREEDQNLKIMVQEDQDVIKNVIILSEDNGEIAFIHIKSNLTMEDLKSLSFNKIKAESSLVNSNQ
jgi:hypothetical protein